ncbi:UNVERIFIED_CONTAM: hypothetical protein HDU68_001210 [Siphonaria sp. JEL0065]|nr:hypothetical protein HDU68_001210 [Siphonaria sp. JEL0065]
MGCGASKNNSAAAAVSNTTQSAGIPVSNKDNINNTNENVAEVASKPITDPKPPPLVKESPIVVAVNHETSEFDQYLISNSESSTNETVIPQSVLFIKDRHCAILNCKGTQVGFLSAGSVFVIATKHAHNPSQAKAITDSSNVNVSSFGWTYMEDILWYKDANADDKLYSVNISTKITICISPPSTTVSHVVGTSASHPEYILTLSNARNPSSPLLDVYNSNLLTGNTNLILQNDGSCIEITPDHEFSSCIVKRIASSKLVEILHIPLDVLTEFAKPQHEIPKTVILEADIGNNTKFFGFSKHLDVVYMSSYGESSNFSSLVSMDLKTLERKVLASHSEADIVGLILNPSTQVPWAYQIHGVRKKYCLLGEEEEVAKEVEKLDKQFHDGRWIIENMSGDAMTWILNVRDEVCNPETYHLYDRQTKKSKLLFDTQPKLRDYALKVTQFVEFFTRDGEKILANLTLLNHDKPDEYSGIPVPLVILIHHNASMMERDEFGYQAHTQLFASRGFAVVSPQIRGTRDLGKKWRIEATIEIQCNDIVDTANWLISKGIAIQEKVALCCVGYGHDELCCAVSMKPYPIAHVLNYPALDASYVEEFLVKAFDKSAPDSKTKTNKNALELEMM